MMCSLALTELWHNQKKFQSKDKSFVIAEPKILKKGKRKGKMRFPDDKAAGVGILLSPATRRKVKSFGSEGERDCWVRERLKGSTCNLFVIAVYLSHRDRVSPCQTDTLKDVEAVLAKVPR